MRMGDSDELNIELAAALERGDERGAFLALKNGADMAPEGEWSPLRAVIDLCGKTEVCAPRLFTMLVSMGADPQGRFEYPLPGYSCTPAAYATCMLARATCGPNDARYGDLCEIIAVLADAGAILPTSVYAALITKLIPREKAIKTLKRVLLQDKAPAPGIGDFLRALETDMEMLDLLSWAWPSSETKDYRGNTPLHYASMAGHDDAVRILLAAGASLDATNRAGETPLLAASGMRETDGAVRLLLRAGASLDIRSQDGTSALERAMGLGPIAGCKKIELIERAMADRV